MGHLTIVTPAPVWELRGLITWPLIGGRRDHLHRLAILQCVAAKTFGLVAPDGRLIAGLMFSPGTVSEMAMACARVARPADYLPGAIAATRLILAGRLQTGTLSIRAFVANENRSGHRLALLTGFRPIDRDDVQTEYEVR